MGVRVLLWVLTCAALGADFVSSSRVFSIPGIVSSTGVSKAVKPVSDMRKEARQLCEAGGLPQFNYSDVDVVVVMASPVCVTQQTIKLLRFNFNFRTIYYVVKHKEFCEYLESIDEHVVCVDENSLIPGISYKALQAPGVSDVIKAHMGTDNRIGWYLQQYLKLGAGLYLKGLSDYYLVWDADNIPIKPFEMFNAKGDFRFCANPSSVKATGYGKFYKALTGMDIVKPVLRGKHYNFVCGYMMFYRCVHGLDAYDVEGPFVREMLAHMDTYLNEQHDGEMYRKGFPWNIHAVAEELIPNGVLFSEYDSYGSWVMSQHPEHFDVDYKISYVRNPLTQSSKSTGDFIKNLKCCLNHKRICALGKQPSLGPHGLLPPLEGTHHHILIWEEHKFRYRTAGQDFCHDPLPPELHKAIELVGHGVGTESKYNRAKLPALSV